MANKSTGLDNKEWAYFVTNQLQILVTHVIVLVE